MLKHSYDVRKYLYFDCEVYWGYETGLGIRFDLSVEHATIGPQLDFGSMRSLVKLN